MVNAQYLERVGQKTSEGEFLYELRNLYEFSPKESESILETARSCLIRENVLKEGEIEVSVISIEERSGKILEKMQKCRIRLTIDKGKEDTEVLKEFGRISLRQVRIQRISTEAIEQQGILSQEDIGRYLRYDVRTIQRDIRELKARGIEVITRGVLHNIGKGQTHKAKIVELFLEGKTFSEIKLKTHHSIGAIKRYLQSFIKVLMSFSYGIKESKEISSVTGLSENLINQYKKLIVEGRKDKQRRAKLADIIKQWHRAGTRLKKSEKPIGTALYPMIGGGI